MRIIGRAGLLIGSRDGILVHPFFAKACNIMKYEITFEENPADEKLQILSEGIDQYTQSKIGGNGNIQLTFFLRDKEGLIVGGVHGNYSKFGWLYISTLWVSERVRGSDYGTQLMKHIEGEAIKAGCINAYLDTFSFQAKPFYEKHGYKVKMTLVAHPVSCERYYLTKKLCKTR